LNSLDRLEGHPDWYRRELVEVKLVNGNRPKMKAWMYIGHPGEERGTKTFADFTKARPKTEPKQTTIGYRGAGKHTITTRSNSGAAVTHSRVRTPYDTDQYAHYIEVVSGTCRKCKMPMCEYEDWKYCEYCGHYEHTPARAW
ncbi:MAG: gamma-glutamylcyclotransferase, partial [Phycisphaerales bacterium]|nr:gamma-glutamylcyclotransferase [Phycisphaerales bacterium]